MTEIKFCDLSQNADLCGNPARAHVSIVRNFDRAGGSKRGETAVINPATGCTDGVGHVGQKIRVKTVKLRRDIIAKLIVLQLQITIILSQRREL